MLTRKLNYQRYISCDVRLIAIIQYNLFLIKKKKIYEYSEVRGLSKVLNSDISTNNNMMYREKLK